MKPVIAIIEGRTNSSRLPGKILMGINGKNSLELIYERLRKVPNLRDIILATTESAHDDKLTEEAKKLGFSVFRGDEQDVLGRIAAAAREHSNIDVLKLTADCPFVDPAIIMNIMDLYFGSNCDFASNTIVRTFPDGMDCGIVRNSVLQEANLEALDPLEREHTSLFIRRNFHRYALVNLDAPSDLAHPEIGLTLDTIEDLEFLTAIASHFDSNETFSCRQILELLSTKPHLRNINSIVNRRGDT